MPRCATQVEQLDCGSDDYFNARPPAGSYLSLTHPTTDLGGEAQVPAMAFWNENAKPPIRSRTGAEIAPLFDGLDLLEPGLVSCAQWRPVLGTTPVQVPQYGAIARKP